MHLQESKTEPFDGGRALRQALGVLRQRKESQRQAALHQERQAAYRAAHSLPGPQFPNMFDASREAEIPCTPRKRICGLDVGTATKKRRSVPDPALRGTISFFGHSIEQAEANERFSPEDRKRAVLALLELTGSPTEVDIRRAFQKKALTLHPDKLPAHLRSWGEEQMKRLNWAYNVLTKKQPARPAPMLALC